METLKDKAAIGLTFFFAILMFGGALGHLVYPEIYAPMVPPFIPLGVANVLAVFAEAATGFLLVFPSTRVLGASAFALLMVGFLPIHVWDMLKDEPVMGSAGAAILRLLIQSLFIVGGFWVSQQLSKTS